MKEECPPSFAASHYARPCSLPLDPRAIIAHRPRLPPPRRQKSEQLHVALLNPQGNFDPANTGLGDHADFGGQLVYVRELAKAIGRLGIQVDILTCRWDQSPWGRCFAATSDFYPDAPNVRILRLDACPGGNKVPLVFLRKEELWPHLEHWVDNIIERYEEEEAFPHVSAGHYADGGLAAELLREKAGVSVGTFTLHSGGAKKLDAILSTVRHAGNGGPETVDAILENLHFDQRIAAERLCLQKAPHIIGSTDEELGQYNHRLYQGAIDTASAADARRLVKITPGINRRIFGEIPTAEDDRTIKGIEAAIARDIPAARRRLPIVLACGRLVDIKNHIATVRAFAGCPALRASANLMLLVAGGREAFDHPEIAFPAPATGSDRAIATEIKKVLDDAGMRNECVIVPGLANHQEEIAAAYRYLARPDVRGVLCHAALYEPFGLMPVEAAACGLPVVVSRNGGPSEIFRSMKGEECAVFINPENSADIADGLLKALAPANWEALKKNGMARVSGSFDWDAAGSEYVALFIESIARDMEAAGGISSESKARMAGFGVSPRLARMALHSKLSNSRRARNAWAYMAAVDIDNTLSYPLDKGSPWSFSEVLEARSIPLLYATGGEIGSVLKRINLGELPVPDAIFSSLGTRAYFNMGNGMFALDEKIQSNLVDFGFDRGRVLREMWKLANEVNRMPEFPVLVRQKGNFGVEQAFKISFHFYCEAERDYEVGFLRRRISDLFSGVGETYQVSVCEDIRCNQNGDIGSRRRFCIDITPTTKDYPINHVLRDVARVRVLTAGDGGNDVGLLCAVDAPGVSVVVGNATADLVSEVCAVSAETSDPARRRLTTKNGVVRDIHMADASRSVGSRSLMEGLELLLAMPDD